MLSRCCCFFFFFNDTATTEIYTLSLHDALPIYRRVRRGDEREHRAVVRRVGLHVEQANAGDGRDRKSTRLNSSHSQISYAVFCLKKKKKTHIRSEQHVRTPTAPAATTVSSCCHC